jgi:selenide, water dikinase
MELETPLRLTQLSHGSGCACKIGPGDLHRILGGLPRSTNPDLLVGTETGDDAGVYRISEELALVQSVDFFTPIVDDPYDFGRIAATNALSDIYAMGGRPLTALNLVAFSLERLGDEPLAEILRGGADVAAEAGVAIVGGHSIDDAEPKYGMAVTGVVHPGQVVRNSTARVGDVVFCTKPIGGGAVTTAAKRGKLPDHLIARCTDVMVTLNRGAAAAALAIGPTAMTDVTGFGLLGHLHGLARESGLAAQVDADAVPVLDGARAVLEDERGVSGGSRRNGEQADGFASFDAAVAPWRARLVCDATTSGGLLVAVDPARAGELPGAVIGRLVDGDPGAIAVV